MAGWLTDGMTAASAANGALPVPSNATIPVDVPQANGAPPQTVAMTAAQWGAGSGGPAVALTDGATIALDASQGSFFSVTLGGSRTLAISNMAAGQKVRLEVTQDGTGSRTLTITAGSGGATKTSGTPLSTTASATDLVEVMNVGTAAAPQYFYYSVAKAFA